MDGYFKITEDNLLWNVKSSRIDFEKSLSFWSFHAVLSNYEREQKYFWLCKIFKIILKVIVLFNQ